jgi:site-specific DNA-methyltransferase (adenine-specific)
MKSEVFNMDCLQAMSEMPDKAFDLAIVDPPYGIDEGNKVLSRVRSVKQKNGSYTPMKAIHAPKDWDKEQPSQEYFDQLFRVAKRHIIFGENYLQFDQKKTSSGRIVWNKVNGDSNFSDCELLWTNLFSSVRMFTYMWNGFCQAESLENPERQRGNKRLNEKRIHPSQKPTDFYFWALKNYAEPGWRILDTHLGSGRSRRAAYELGFYFEGYERDVDYFAAHQMEFSAFLCQSKLFSLC